MRGLKTYLLFSVLFTFCLSISVLASLKEQAKAEYIFPIQPPFIDLPTWVKPGEFLDLPLEIINQEPEDLIYTYEIVEDNGTEGWLNVSGLSGVVHTGSEVGTLHLNNGGVQTTPELLLGRVILYTEPSLSYNLEVSLLVTDTLVPTIIDTISGHLSLVVSSNGNYGNMGSGKVNLDFVNNGIDCDTTADTYLYDGSPIVLTIDGSDTLLSSAIFNSNWLTEDGFKPVAAGLTEPSHGSGIDYNWSSTGTFTIADSTIAFEQIFFAPTAPNANYMIKALKVWSHDGLAHSGIRIGEAIDWDIPSDTGSHNLSAIDPVPSRNLIYQVGTEYHQDDTGASPSCMDSDRRFGGMAFLKSIRNGVDETTDPYSFYTARSDSEVYPTGDFVAGRLWNLMGNSGTTVETADVDQHMVMCYHPSLSLAASDTVVYWISLVTVYDGVGADVGAAADAAEVFYGQCGILYPCNAACCQGIRGNVDSSYPDDCYNLGLIDISDLVYLVDFMFTNGPPPSCGNEANVDGDIDEIIDISDLVYLVDYVFNSGPEPPSCP